MAVGVLQRNDAAGKILDRAFGEIDTHPRLQVGRVAWARPFQVGVVALALTSRSVSRAAPGASA